MLLPPAGDYNLDHQQPDFPKYEVINMVIQNVTGRHRCEDTLGQTDCQTVRPAIVHCFVNDMPSVVHTKLKLCSEYNKM
jgi:hypothetical protein